MQTGRPACIARCLIQIESHSLLDRGVLSKSQIGPEDLTRRLKIEAVLLTVTSGKQ